MLFMVDGKHELVEAHKTLGFGESQLKLQLPEIHKTLTTI